MAKKIVVIGSLVVGGLLSGCLAGESPPTQTEMVEALQAYVADAEGFTDSKGRYRGPKVGKVDNLKCNLVDPKSYAYECSYKVTIRRRNKEEDTETRTFRKTEVEIEERGKTVKKKMWRVTTS
ncbi:MAG: hypothetical protein SFW09_12270 [Hyphomicrobiaceae bacterium]|nr:hypothetical protein [Hyphomicrobiaceae bacterium]